MRVLTASRIVARIAVRQHKQSKKDSPLYPVWVVAKGWGHGGYEWYGLTDDGSLLCEKCILRNYRQIVASTRDKQNDGWRILGVTYSGEMESREWCADCYREIGPDLEDN